MEEKLKEARSALKDAVARMHTAGDAIANADDKADITALSASFDEAEAEVERNRDNVTRLERIAKARLDNPVIETEETDDSEDRTKVTVTSEPRTYEKYKRGGNINSFFSDLVSAREGRRSAVERLQRHMTEMEKEERALNSTDGTGGDFVAPLWMMDEWAAVARAGRPFANAVRNLPLPPNTDSINIPKVLTGTTTATQADGGAVSSTDATTGSISVPVKTVAGQQDVARQLLDRSVPGIDEIIFADLAADYATRLDVQCLNGSGGGSNAKGVLQDAAILTVTYTDASPTVPELYPKGADAVQQIHTNRFLPPTLVVMHPRRWGWHLAALDSSNRPLITPYAPFNAAGLSERIGAENIVGNWHGLPVMVDASIPSTLGAGTNEDRIIVCRVEENILWEDDVPTFKVYEGVLSNNLQVRLQVYGYFAFTSERYSKANAQISGTGLAAPTF